jgi:predicted transporter
MIGSIVFIYSLTFVSGLVAYRGFSGVSTRQSIRVLAGGVSGVGTGAILENGAAYSFFTSAYYGGMGISGYVFIGSFVFLIGVWVFNFIETKDRLVL